LIFSRKAGVESESNFRLRTPLVCGHPSPLTPAVGHVPTFAVRAALVAGQWQKLLMY